MFKSARAFMTKTKIINLKRPIRYPEQYETSFFFFSLFFFSFFSFFLWPFLKWSDLHATKKVDVRVAKYV